MTEFPPGPGVQLDFARHWCPGHLAPYRARWPAGAPTAMVRLFGAFVEDERILAAGPKDADGKVKAQSLQALVDEFSPLCCFVGAETMAAIYAEALGG